MKAANRKEFLNQCGDDQADLRMCVCHLHPSSFDVEGAIDTTKLEVVSLASTTQAYASVGIDLVKFSAGDGNDKNGTPGVFHALNHASSAGKGEALRPGGLPPLTS